MADFSEQIWDKLGKIDGKLDGLIKTVGHVATRAETAHTRINGVEKTCEGARSLSVRLFLASLTVIVLVAGLVKLT